jgi:hypothetical protein
MSLKANPTYQIPEDTKWVAKSALPKGKCYMLMRDTFGDFFATTDFKHLSQAKASPLKIQQDSLWSSFCNLPNNSPTNAWLPCARELTSVPVAVAT